MIAYELQKADSTWNLKNVPEKEWKIVLSGETELDLLKSFVRMFNGGTFADFNQDSDWLRLVQVETTLTRKVIK